MQVIEPYSAKSTNKNKVNIWS